MGAPPPPFQVWISDVNKQANANYDATNLNRAETDAKVAALRAQTDQAQKDRDLAFKEASGKVAQNLATYSEQTALLRAQTSSQIYTLAESRLQLQAETTANIDKILANQQLNREERNAQIEMTRDKLKNDLENNKMRQEQLRNDLKVYLAKSESDLKVGLTDNEIKIAMNGQLKIDNVNILKTQTENTIQGLQIGMKTAREAAAAATQQIEIQMREDKDTSDNKRKLDKLEAEMRLKRLNSGDIKDDAQDAVELARLKKQLADVQGGGNAVDVMNEKLVIAKLQKEMDNVNKGITSPPTTTSASTNPLANIDQTTLIYAGVGIFILILFMMMFSGGGGGGRRGYDRY